MEVFSILNMKEEHCKYGRRDGIEVSESDGNEKDDRKKVIGIITNMF